jgi:Lon protease-like protein
MSAPETVHVNFSKPMPLFPLHSATLLPHGIIQLHVFEPRYRQMVADVLDGSGQIAMAVFDGDQWKREYHGRPPLRPAVCIGQIVQHVKHENARQDGDEAEESHDTSIIAAPDEADEGRAESSRSASDATGPGSAGTYDIILQGVCRARIAMEQPSDANRLYRTALLEPLGQPEVDDRVLVEHRGKLASMLSSKPLSDLRSAEGFAEYLRGTDVPANVIIELLAYTYVPLEDVQRRYAFLAAPDPLDRARMIEDTLDGIATLLRRVAPQRTSDAPKGCNWN